MNEITSIQPLIQQAKELLTQIENHPEVIESEYTPEISMADAKYGLNEILFHLNYISLADAEYDIE